jgi:hypothetical protein
VMLGSTGLGLAAAALLPDRDRQAAVDSPSPAPLRGDTPDDGVPRRST